MRGCLLCRQVNGVPFSFLFLCLSGLLVKASTLHMNVMWSWIQPNIVQTICVSNQGPATLFLLFASRVEGYLKVFLLCLLLCKHNIFKVSCFLACSFSIESTNQLILIFVVCCLRCFLQF